ncbi:conjugal transfer protein TraF [Marinomonas sp. GJ51-6]|uniref:conjugal transfer protein TraF n=1 Tax=Marinomonas sp. GJ51-6 TaxID=2992802 RepID=UPI0029343204|nr:conjugal transfer protein TraF [Marinomonas sp. GJ51-6]WOD06423.1 conjugal transfer protein TraF [Marinomonas sp. GJ51-6]
MAAMPVNHPVGSSFTLSSSPNQRALSTALGNPAAPFLMVNEQDDDSFRFGILELLGIGVEMGDVSDLEDQVEELEDILDGTYYVGAEDDANEILDQIGDTAYVKTSVNMQVPFMPVIYKTKNSGAFMLDSSFSLIGKASLLAGEVTESGGELETDASFYAQAVSDLAVGLGYSQALWQNSHGMLVGGVKASFHQLSQGRALVELEDESSESEDALEDAFDETASSSGVGLDLGAIWVSHYYQAGVTFANINEPEFDGMDITGNTASDSYGISEEGVYIMEMQTTIDAALTTPGKQVTLGLSYDVNSVKDAVGDEYQWAAASLSYYGDSHFLPGLRLGLRQNMAGSELSYASAGLTLLKRLNLDLAVALDTVEDEDGEETPRSFFFSLGYSTAF